MTLFYAGFLHYVIQHNNLVNDLYQTWQFQAAVVFVLLVIVFIWLACEVVFDEQKQLVTIRRGLTRFLPTLKVYYSEIDKIIIKRYAYEDEDGYVTNEGYFHLQLKHDKSYLLMVFQDKDAIENVLKKLKMHTELNIQSY